MFYKGILFDLDNTLYDYDLCHDKALKEVLDYLITINDEFIFEELLSIYEQISNDLKYELKMTASSHNKAIYFKQLIEKLNLSYNHHSHIHQLYWKTFYNTMTPFSNVEPFIRYNKNNGIKIGIITDYETEYQIEKLKKLDLLKHIDIIITSEEVGIEKPSYKIFEHVLNKMNLKNDQVIMIGDNYEKDIIGAKNMNIISYWMTNKNDLNSNQFNDYKSLLNYLREIEFEINRLTNLSRFCGERFDLTQAGGGNISVKCHDYMFIKASGYKLADITEESGYSTLDNKKLLFDIKANNYNDLMSYNVIGNLRSSMETYMHSILFKYTIHLHPIHVNRFLIQNDNNIVQKMFPDSLILSYIPPGKDICYELQKYYNNNNIIFLKNHGIIITSDDYDEIYNILDDVVCKFEKFYDLNYDKYKFTNTISKYINTSKYDYVSYLVEDKIINDYFCNKIKLFAEKITMPDVFIYCGFEIVYINGLKSMDEYNDKYGDYPSVIINNNNIYTIGKTLNKCRDIESVLKANLIIMDTDTKKIYLSDEELQVLNNMDAEKYRKKLY